MDEGGWGRRKFHEAETVQTDIEKICTIVRGTLVVFSFSLVNSLERECDNKSRKVSGDEIRKQWVSQQKFLSRVAM